jgi:hypothetical protein
MAYYSEIAMIPPREILGEAAHVLDQFKGNGTVIHGGEEQ